MAVKNATELLLLMENTLGLAPALENTTPMWKWRTIQAGRINRKVKTSSLFTWTNLELTVAYLWQKRQPLDSPMGVFYFVKDALALAPDPEPERPVGDLITGAVRQEREAQHPGWDGWVSRLLRSSGGYRKGVYDEWVTERGHLWAS